MKQYLLLIAILFSSFGWGACPAPVLTVPIGSTITVSWTAPTKNTDNSAITGTLGYNVYNLASGAPVLLTHVTTTSATATNLGAGLVCYDVTALVAGIESVPSPVLAVNVASTPNAPTSLTCTFTLPATGGAASGTCVTSP